MKNNYREEAKQLLEEWDNFDLINTISVGGIGPGYEQAIHVACFEVLREIISRRIMEKEINLEGDTLKPAWDRCEPLGLSGAQAGCATALARDIYYKGMDNIKADLPLERKIIISKRFPDLVDNRTQEEKDDESMRREYNQYKRSHQNYAKLAARFHQFIAKHDMGRPGDNVFDLVFNDLERLKQEEANRCLEA